jgi:hypothetical protein
MIGKIKNTLEQTIGLTMASIIGIFIGVIVTSIFSVIVASFSSLVMFFLGLMIGTRSDRMRIISGFLVVIFTFLSIIF